MSRFSSREDNVLRVKIQKLSLSPPLCATLVGLLDPPHLQVLHGVVQLAKVGCNWFFCFLFLMSEQCPFILTWRVFSVSPTYCIGRTSCMIWDKPDIFILHEMLLLMWYFLPVTNVLPVITSCQHLHCICCCWCWGVKPLLYFKARSLSLCQIHVDLAKIVY